MINTRFITTYSGISFNPLEPNEEDILTEDIAHALSLLCRANGHYKYFYSVAQHSINCAKEAQARNYSERIQLACLLHDASEAYISDVTRPVKATINEFIKIEESLQKFIFKVYGLADLKEEELRVVRKIDDEILQYEMTLLFPSYQGAQALKILIGKQNFALTSMMTVKAEFMKMIHNLSIK